MIVSVLSVLPGIQDGERVQKHLFAVEMQWGILIFNPLSTTNFQSILLADQITLTGNEMGILTSRFANVWSLIKLISVMFTQSCGSLLLNNAQLKC